MRSSPRWFPFLILALFGIGLVGIMLNYLGLLPGGASNVYLFIGLGLHRGGVHRRHPLALTAAPDPATRERRRGEQVGSEVTTVWLSPELSTHWG